MKPFALHTPQSIEQAIQYLQDDNSLVKPMSGGTALMLMMKSGVYEPEALVSLSKVQTLQGIAIDTNGDLQIQAMTTLSEIEHSPIVKQYFSVISQTMKKLANVRVRNVACLGGALAHGDPHMDMPPLMTVLGATLKINSASGTKNIPIENFYLGYYTTLLSSGEIIQSITVPALTNRYCLYLKCTTRSADDWPTLGVAINLGLKGKLLDSPKVVLSAVVETPTRLSEVEEFLTGKTPSETLFIEAGEIAASHIEPEDDARGSASYKKQLIKVYIRRAIQNSLQGKVQS
jgi:carbon-monoxide dehydrogenase medium subunit